MFKSISWQEFFYTTTVVIGAYYAISIFLLYTKEIVSKFKKPDNNSLKIEKESTEGLSNSLMGKIQKVRQVERLNAHQKIVPAEEISVASEALDKAENHVPSDTFLVGTVSDLLHEIETLSKVIADSGGSKEDGISMFQALLVNYSQLSGTHHQEAINRVINDQCRNVCEIEIELHEIRSWWHIESQKESSR